MALRTFKLKDSVFSTVELERERIEPGPAGGADESLRSWTLTTQDGWSFMLRTKVTHHEHTADAHLRCADCGATIMDTEACASCTPLFVAENSRDLDAFWTRLYDSNAGTPDSYLAVHEATIRSTFEAWLMLQTPLDPLEAVVMASDIYHDLTVLLGGFFEAAQPPVAQP